jgi:hypothetical protein
MQIKKNKKYDSISKIDETRAKFGFRIKVPFSEDILDAKNEDFSKIIQ